MRDQIDWRINESTFPRVVEELEERRGSQGPQTPPPGEGLPPAETSAPRPDTTG